MRLPGATLTERWVRVEPGVELRVLRWDPEEPTVDWPAVVVSGWTSFVEGWTPLLSGLAVRQRTWFVETREKPTARLARRPRWRDFRIPNLARDLAVVCGALDDPVGEQVLYASSLGATLALEAMKTDSLPLRGAFFIAPNVRFRYPFWSWPLLRLPPPLYPPALKIVMAHMRRSRVDAEAEPTQWARYEESLKRAELRRLVASARAFDGYDLRPGLERVCRPVAVAHAPTDTLHAAEDWQQILQAVPGAVDVQCPSDWHLHCADVLPDVDAFVAGLG